MEDEAAAKPRMLEHHRGLRDALSLPSFHMEDLPEEIQPLVLSLISLKEAARTSIVSRNWKNFWTCYPNLCFDGTKDQSTDEDVVKIERGKFIETVDSIIQQHSGIALNKFRIRCALQKKFSDHLDRWICFAAASKAKIIHMDLWPKRNCLGPTENVYHFPLEALDAQDGPFIQSLFLTNVSIKPHSNICGFTKLRRLHLDRVQIIGDLPGLLLNCSILEDLEIISCPGMADLNIPHQLDKLRHMVIMSTGVKMVNVYVPGLTHFGYEGDPIPILLHGCSKLEKATLQFYKEINSNKALGHVITGIPSISGVRVLNVSACMRENQPVWSSQVYTLPARPVCMFTNLRHLTCEIIVLTHLVNSHSGLLVLAHYLDLAPQLETLELHMYYDTFCYVGWLGEEVSRMRRLDHLKTVYMSGFRCHRAQVALLYGILENGVALEHVTIEPMTRIFDSSISGILEHEICHWAHRASERFGKAINVVKVPRRRW